MKGCSRVSPKPTRKMRILSDKGWLWDTNLICLWVHVILGDCRQIISSSCAIVQSSHKAAFKSLHINLCGNIMKKTFTWYHMGISKVLGEGETAFQEMPQRAWRDDPVYQNWHKSMVLVYEITPWAQSRVTVLVRGCSTWYMRKEWRNQFYSVWRTEGLRETLFQPTAAWWKDRGQSLTPLKDAQQYNERRGTLSEHGKFWLNLKNFCIFLP